MNYYQKMFDLVIEGSLGFRRQMRVSQAKKKSMHKVDPQGAKKVTVKNYIRAKDKGLLGKNEVGNPITRSQIKGFNRNKE